VVVAGRGHAAAHEVVVLAEAVGQGCDASDVELTGRVCLPGVEEVEAGVGAHRPAVVLPGAVDAGEGLLVEGHVEAELRRLLFADLHEEHVVVGGEGGLAVDRGHLVLGRGRRRRPCLFTASFDLSRGVLSSMQAPRCVTKEQGTRSTLSRMKQGEERSQVVKAAAVCVARRPPFGKDEPSVSPKKRRSYGRVATMGLFASSEDQS
jgi:hypothetical protein